MAEPLPALRREGAPPRGPDARTPSTPAADSAPWRLQLLGGLQLVHHQRGVARLPSRAASALLARLALAPQRAHAREELIELLWPGVALDVGRNRLRQVLSTLKSLLQAADGSAPLLLATRLTVALAPQAVDCDVLQFERRLRLGDWAGATALYLGELLPGLNDEWIEDERRRLAALAERAVERAAERLAEAPSPQPRLDGPGPPPLAHLPQPLPHFLGRYIGADEPAARLQALVRGHRLVTVLGPGGAGKTRLVVELAQAMRASAPTLSPTLTDAAPTWDFDAVLFVSLVDCSRTDQADAALAASVMPGSVATGPQPLHAMLGGRRCLLLLDNLEPLADAAGPWVQQLLAALPGLHVLVTSRRPVGLPGEQELALAPLRLPPPGADLGSALASPALALLLDRARAVRADLGLTEHNLALMVALARALEGWPLAIELAASRLRCLSPAELLQGLQGPQPAALLLLARPQPRHRHDTISRTIEASWVPLSAGARALLAGLTVWRGTFTLQAAQAFNPQPAHQTWAALDELVAHSLVRVASEADGVRRFALFQPVREFAAAQLDAAAARAWRSRLRGSLLQWARSLPATPALARLRDELPNLQAALESSAADSTIESTTDSATDSSTPIDTSAATRAAEDAVDLLVAWRRVADDVALPSDALAHAERAVTRAATPERRGLGASLLGPMWFRAGHAGRALQQAQAGLAAAPQDNAARAGALHRLARVLWRSRHRVDEVQPLLDEALALEAAQPDPDLRASLLALMAFVANHGQRDPTRGEALHQQALALRQALGQQHAVNDGRYNLAVCAANARRWPEALERAQAVAASARALGHVRLLSQALNLLGNVHSGQRQWQAAQGCYRECIQLSWHEHLAFDLAYGLWNLPRTLAHRGHGASALQLAAFAQAYWQQHFGALDARDQRDLQRVRRLAGRTLDEAALQSAWLHGLALAPAQAVALALETSSRPG